MTNAIDAANAAMRDANEIQRRQAAQAQEDRAIRAAMLEAQQDTNALLKDLISEIKTLRIVMEDKG